MKNWLALFVEHYRQPVSELSAVAYSEGLSDLSAEELDAACREAMRTSEFMPVVATIRIALFKIQHTEVDNVSGFQWDPELERERIERKISFEKLVAEGKEKPYQPPEPEKPKLRVSRSTQSIEEQKEELRKRGYLQ